MALGDKVEDLQRTTAILYERVDSVRKSLDALENAHKELARELAELRRQSETASALHRRALEDFEKWKDDQKKEREERSRRLAAKKDTLGPVTAIFPSRFRLADAVSGTVQQEGLPS